MHLISVIGNIRPTQTLNTTFNELTDDMLVKLAFHMREVEDYRVQLVVSLLENEASRKLYDLIWSKDMYTIAEPNDNPDLSDYQMEAYMDAIEYCVIFAHCNIGLDYLEEIRETGDYDDSGILYIMYIDNAFLDVELVNRYQQLIIEEEVWSAYKGLVNTEKVEVLESGVSAEERILLFAERMKALELEIDYTGTIYEGEDHTKR